MSRALASSYVNIPFMRQASNLVVHYLTLFVYSILQMCTRNLWIWFTQSLQSKIRICRQLHFHSLMTRAKTTAIGAESTATFLGPKMLSEDIQLVLTKWTWMALIEYESETCHTLWFGNQIHFWKPIVNHASFNSPSSDDVICFCLFGAKLTKYGQFRFFCLMIGLNPRVNLSHLHWPAALA